MWHGKGGPDWQHSISEICSREREENLRSIRQALKVIREAGGSGSSGDEGVKIWYLTCCSQNKTCHPARSPGVSHLCPPIEIRAIHTRMLEPEKHTISIQIEGKSYYVEKTQANPDVLSLNLLEILMSIYPLCRGLVAPIQVISTLALVQYCSLNRRISLRPMHIAWRSAGDWSTRRKMIS